MNSTMHAKRKRRLPMPELSVTSGEGLDRFLALFAVLELRSGAHSGWAEPTERLLDPGMSVAVDHVLSAWEVVLQSSGPSLRERLVFFPVLGEKPPTRWGELRRLMRRAPVDLLLSPAERNLEVAVKDLLLSMSELSQAQILLLKPERGSRGAFDDRRFLEILRNVGAHALSAVTTSCGLRRLDLILSTVPQRRALSYLPDPGTARILVPWPVSKKETDSYAMMLAEIMRVGLLQLREESPGQVSSPDPVPTGALLDEMVARTLRCVCHCRMPEDSRVHDACLSLARKLESRNAEKKTLPQPDTAEEELAVGLFSSPFAD